MTILQLSPVSYIIRFALITLVNKDFATEENYSVLANLSMLIANLK